MAPQTAAGPAVTFANADVLEFYRQLPFNYHGSAADQARMVRAQNMANAYPPLAAVLRRGTRVLEVGCGVGWFASSLAHHFGARVTAIDFNPVAIGRAREIAGHLGAAVAFEAADLFVYEPAAPFEVVVSLGVLHHTDDCLYALDRLCRRFVAPGGHVFVGLYHKYGRRPFLDHFEAMKRAGRAEAEMLARYRELHSRLKDDVLALSWFRDQVLHPHETQHTVAEVAAVFEAAGVELTSCSVNGFRPFAAVADLVAAEPALAEAGAAALAKNTYYPGFFLCMGRRRTAAPGRTPDAGLPR